MKLFKFNVKETWFGGVTARQYEIKARTLQSAKRKLYQIQGNRCWEIEEVAP